MSALILGLLFVAVYSLSHGEISYDPLYAAAYSLQSLPSSPSPRLWTSSSLFRKTAMWWASWISTPRRESHTCAQHTESSFATGMAPFTTSSTWPWPAPSAEGKYSSEIRPAFFLTIPYLLVPCWAGVRVFSQPRAPTCCTANTVQEEQRKGLLQRPADLALVTYLILAGFFTLFRGLVVLDCPTDSCFVYIYQYEPYLRDPVAYPKVQMLMYMFYVLPFCGLAAYALTFPGCSWLPDWALVFAGAIGQAQFSHMGASMHLRTPFTYRVPEDTWGCFFVCNLLYALGPHLLAYRCLQWPAFFHQPPPSSPIALHKKQQ
ncbi:transmembrane 6 superfamily member 2 isoform X6 [Macaca fascicularis]